MASFLLVEVLSNFLCSSFISQLFPNFSGNIWQTFFSFVLVFTNVLQRSSVNVIFSTSNGNPHPDFVGCISSS